MENLDLLSNDLQVTPQGLGYLAEVAKWGKFLAIMGFILCGITVALSFFVPVLLTQLPPYNTMSSEFSSTMKIAMTIIYLLLALLFFFPCFYLYKYSVKMQSAVKTISQENFDESLMNMKSMFKFYGIFTIIILSFYAVAFIVGIVAAAMR
ncbi:MAG: DUF5362 family protein [Ginsengibacter sp.]